MNTNANNPTFSEYFGLKDGRVSFAIEPEKDSDLLLGSYYREQFDDVYYGIQEKAYSMLGYKAVLWGDFGMGKTHFLRHLYFAIENPAKVGKPPMLVKPFYLKCNELGKKAPFSDFERELIRAIPSEYLGDIVNQYLTMQHSNTPGIKSFWEISLSEEIAAAFEVVGIFPGKARYDAIRWLCGEKLTSAEITNISKASREGKISGQVSKSKEFGAILEIISTVLSKVDSKVLIYLIDESERLRNISETDAIESWLACLRQITSIPNLGLIIAVGVGTRDQLPPLLTEQEIERRIGTPGYKEWVNLNPIEIDNFIKDMLSRLVDIKSATAVKNIPSGSFDSTLWPFSKEGFEAFVEYCNGAPLGRRPSEIVNGIQTLAGRAYRLKLGIIDEHMVQKILIDRR